MKHEEFLRQLRVLLGDIEREELNQIEEYYKELIYDGMEQGYTEEEVLKGFGAPEEAAKRVREEYGGLVVYGKRIEDPGYLASNMVHTVKVEAANVRIQVRTVKTGSVRVLFKPRDNSDEVTYSEENGIFSFTHKMKGFLHLNWLNLFMDFSVIILEIPKDYSGNLELKTSNAAIKVANLAELSKGEFISSNGRIKLENVRAEEIFMYTQNGFLRGTNLISDKITMETCNGSIVGTIIGNQNDYSIDSRTINGTNNLANIDMVEGRAKKLTAKTANGRVHIDFIE